MPEDQVMDKRSVKQVQVSGNTNQEPKLRPNPDYNGGSRGGRGRRSTPFGGGQQGRRPPPQRQERRPRERAPATQAQQYSHRGQVAESSELGSVYNGGNKKGYHDASHLLNFRCESARDRHAERYSSSQWQLQRAAHWQQRPHWHPPSRTFRPKHVKEQYLQAKCQFVVRDDGAYADNLSDPDRLVDWAYVEQVWLHEEDVEPTTCPICLYPPVAARVTRCGHTYCVACLLHYLALSDQASRRCPICEQTVHPDEVRRCRLLRRAPVQPGDSVTFRLMRRRPESLLGQPADAEHTWEELITLSDTEEKQRLTKLILASPEQVSSLILAPERAVLEQQLAELGQEPEACFVQQALTQLEEAEQAAAERAVVADAKPRRPAPEAAASQTTPLPAAAAGDAVVYESAFDERTVDVDETQGAMVSPEDDAVGGGGFGGARCRTASEASSTDVTAADLEVAETPRPAAGPADQHSGLLHYYQAEDGAPVFLHALNCRMLLEEYGGWERCPARLTASLVDVDMVTMTAGFRQRLRSLRHLPLTSQLQVCEARLEPPLVSEPTLALFKDQIRKREQRRREKQRRDRQRERRMRQEERQQRRHADATYDQAFPVERRRTPSPEPPAAAPAQAEPEAAASSGPSFAALLRGGGGGGARVWPSAAAPPPVVVKMPASDVREDGDPAAPSFSDSWSAGLAAALERVDRGQTGAVGEAKPKGRKGKKGRAVLVSGGLNF